MGVVVFDADVLIGFLNRDDAHHKEAADRVERAYLAGERLMVCATTYCEILVGPLRSGKAEARHVEIAIGGLSFEIAHVDMALAERAAAVRLDTGLKLPDAFVIATAVHVERRQQEDVRLETFDGRLRKAFAALRPSAGRD